MTELTDPTGTDDQPAVMPSPRQIDVEITSLCNLRCSYCYYFDNDDVDYQDLIADRWLRFWNECGDAGIMRINLSGGEPFIRDDLKVLLEGIVRNRMRFVILSNGGLIRDDTAAFIAGTGRCDSVQVSVDGSHPETHDALRGEGSFGDAVRGIRVLQRHEVPVAVRVTIHRHNVSDLREITRFLLEELGLPGFSTNAAGIIGSCSGNAGDILLTTDQRQEAMETLLALWEEYGGRITASAGPLADALMWRRMEDARAAQAPPFPTGGYLTGCGCHRSTLAVRADGAFVPCTMLAHEVLGRIGRDSLLDVWQHSSLLNRMRRRHTVPLDGFETCRECPWVSYCTGNCAAMAYSLTGDMDRPGLDACLYRFLQNGGRIPGEKRTV